MLTAPSIDSQRPKSKSILPFLPLAFFLLQFPWAIVCAAMEFRHMDDDNGVTPAVQTEMKFVRAVLFVPVVFGLVVGIFALAKSRSYGRTARKLAEYGTLLCGITIAFAVWIILRR